MKVSTLAKYLGIAAALVGGYMVYISFPELRRYLRMHSM